MTYLQIVERLKRIAANVVKEVDPDGDFSDNDETIIRLRAGVAIMDLANEVCIASIETLGPKEAKPL